ncbi:hypothetical protein ASF69_14385 [Rhizobium sp. Leaf311]|uniref:cation:proton antiporter n=1 Tax=Rhizobium sp. Leaf311 TaxID=1736332 RepID=UPI000714C811|nr:cation:proton antiporter [Rhizobium sp. Leaf311]KQQ58565.1 hypothetical protein ASF69_14385 [Rhizobium sp. Leaf311]
MTPETLVSFATIFASAILSVAFLLTVFRVVVGPTLPDRVVALDMLVGIAIGFLAVIAIRTGYKLYVDIAISLCLVGFLATVAFARFVLSRTPGPEHRGREVLDGTDIVSPKAAARRAKAPSKARRKPRS